MSKETVTRCDKCLKEISWLNGAHVALSERHTSGSKERAYPYQDSPQLDLCDECFTPMRKAFTEVRLAQEARIPKAATSHSYSYDHV